MTFSEESDHNMHSKTIKWSQVKEARNVGLGKTDPLDLFLLNNLKKKNHADSEWPWRMHLISALGSASSSMLLLCSEDNDSVPPWVCRLSFKGQSERGGYFSSFLSPQRFYLNSSLNVCFFVLFYFPSTWTLGLVSCTAMHSFTRLLWFPVFMLT